MNVEALHTHLDRRFGPAVRTRVEHGLLTAQVDRERWLAALRFARDDLGCTFFDWLTGVDELERGVSVVVHLWSPLHRHHLMLRTLVPGYDLRLASATTVFRGANWHERETHEMFGVGFDDHPNLVPLLLPDGFEGHPLRKDFVLASRVARPWPGAVDPGQSSGEVATKRRQKRPPGVPDPDVWGPTAGRAEP